MQQVHVTPVSQHLASHRNAEGYRNYGERLYVEGRLDAMRKEKEVGGWRWASRWAHGLGWRAWMGMVAGSAVLLARTWVRGAQLAGMGQVWVDVQCSG